MTSFNRLQTVGFTRNNSKEERWETEILHRLPESEQRVPKRCVSIAVYQHRLEQTTSCQVHFQYRLKIRVLASFTDRSKQADHSLSSARLWRFLYSASAILQRLMDHIIEPGLDPFCFAYLDILVMRETFEEHLKNLLGVFLRLRDASN